MKTATSNSLRRIVLMAVMIPLVITGMASARAEEKTGTVQDYFEEGFRMMSQQKYYEAIEAFEKARDLRPDVAEIHNALGMAHMQLKDSVDDAIAEFEEAVRVKPDFAEAYVNLGVIYSGLVSDYDSAEEYFRTAIKYDPKHSRAHFGLGWLYLVKYSDPQKAWPVLEKAAELDPGNTQTLYYLGLAYVMAGKRAKALKPISELKKLGAADEASQLEAMMHQQSEYIREKLYEPSSGEGGSTEKKL